MKVFPFEVIGRGSDRQHPTPEEENADDQYVLRKGQSLQRVRALKQTEWRERQLHSERAHKKCNDYEPEENHQQGD
jgi:hypothetical protein